MVKDYLLNSYDFDLPKELIAQYPLKKRRESRLLVVDRRKKEFFESKFFNIHKYLPANSIIIFNESKVIPARLIGKKTKTGGKVEFLLLTPIPLLEVVKKGSWNLSHTRGLMRPSKRIKEGDLIKFSDHLYLIVKKKHEFGRTDVILKWRGDILELIEKTGNIPLPPYIKRHTVEEDLHRYQTIFANKEKAGSVAAPTAGLHFDKEVMKNLKQKGIEPLFITLYVGPGTFEPVRCEDIRLHKMHSEYVEVDKDTAKKIKTAKLEGKKVIAVGTTSVRTVEGIFKKLGKLDEYEGWIDLFIYPGFSFKIVDILITNFHLPKSSLLMLVSAFAHRELILQAYNYAIEKNFRFFSYGDCMLIL